jgi:hydrogenase maturation protein HypF
MGGRMSLEDRGGPMAEGELGSPSLVPADCARQRLRITGVVQGVGFRPFVYGLALRAGLAGFVGNDNQGVFVEVEGASDQLDQFCQAIRAEAPPLARIEAISRMAQPVLGEQGFRIVESQTQPDALTLVSPDVALCPDCRRELFDLTNRRYLYPFINCTHCGPRFTIIRDLPYDRPLTTMAGFSLCPDCAVEYQDPLDRRFHAQPTACPVCGPRVWIEDAGQTGAISVNGANRSVDTVRTVHALLDRGAILALKGVGGFHLACDASSDLAVRTLRGRKGRGDKPFAVMVADLDQARAIAHVDAHEAALLSGTVRPIVLLRKRVAPATTSPTDDGGRKTDSDSAVRPPPLVSDAVAPGNPLIGVMLPYSPLHELLLTGRGPLVMTSGNLSDEPIVIDNQEARERLGMIADAFVMHDRGIHTRCDDSVVRVWRGAELPIRRSRGYAPFPVALPRPVPPILAVGGELKATFCLARDAHAFMSAHIGDMANLETLEAFAAAVDHLQHLFRITPALLACDLHPGYLGTRWAERRAADTGVPLVHVQHHHAHVAAVMAENGWSPEAGPVIGFSFDGTGYGWMDERPDGQTDGGLSVRSSIWGGEVLLTTYARAERVGHLAEVPLAGGDAAIKKPYRVALAHLRAAGVAWADTLAPVRAATQTEQRVLARQFETGFNAVPTSSLGRLFDAVASLLEVRQLVSYEGQAAIELEALALQAGEGDGPAGYAFDLRADGVFDAAPVVAALVSDLRRGTARASIAARFHAAVADVIVRSAERVRGQTGVTTAALSGGVFQNGTVLELACRQLSARGFELLVHRQVPPNDGGLALGQVMVAAAQAGAG